MRFLFLIFVPVIVACSDSKDEGSSFLSANSVSLSNGKSCWEAPGVSDQNGDGKIDALDCVGPEGLRGPEGQAGKNCWDDLDDPNGDGVNDAADCRYEISRPVIYSSKNIVDLNTGPQVVLEIDDSETTVIHIQKPANQASGWYCLNINVEKACGDVDGCRMIFKTKNIAQNDDNLGAYSWEILAEHYQHFFNPANSNQGYNEHANGVTYRSLHGGGNGADRQLVTGSASAAQNYLGYGHGYFLTLRNHVYSHCGNFGVSASQPVHSEAHQFTLEVHASYLGTLIIQNRP